jgi:hypothetical protein
VIQLHVDATDLDHRVFRVRESIPVAGPGRTTLFYPKWLPGNHSPTGPIDKLAGLVIHGNTGARLEWQRDPVEMYAFHVDVPAGVTQLDLQFEYVSPKNTSQWRVVMTCSAAMGKGLAVSGRLYARRIAVDATISYGNWFASALPVPLTGDSVRFATVPLGRWSIHRCSPARYPASSSTRARHPVRLSIFAARRQNCVPRTGGRNIVVSCARLSRCLVRVTSNSTISCSRSTVSPVSSTRSVRTAWGSYSGLGRNGRRDLLPHEMTSGTASSGGLRTCGRRLRLPWVGMWV